VPELPEVETTLRGIKPHLLGQKIKQIQLRNPSLRWPVPQSIIKHLKNKTILDLTRRAKYILFKTEKHTFILHLGMTGSVRILTEKTEPRKHDHIDFEFDNGTILRITDPRRFGALLYTENDKVNDHFLLNKLGPEPLSKNLTAAYLLQRANKRKVAIKTFLMNNHIVVGVGNIYATESLFASGLHPNRPVNTVTLKQFEKLVDEVQSILKAAIKKGGTTLKDFSKSDGKPGYFKQYLRVYGRPGLPCLICKTELQKLKIGQRNTVYCPTCQT